jgi:hypothetical protein
MFVIKPEDFIGKQFGHYQLVEFLKDGGFGLVYKAEHLRLHRRSLYWLHGTSVQKKTDLASLITLIP